ncbi:hypothetical protein D3C74_449650 [compost metagenome]
MQPQFLQHVDDILVLNAFIKQCQVIAYGAFHNLDVLRHHCYPTAQLLQLTVADVDSGQLDLALLRIVEAQQQPGKR